MRDLFDSSDRWLPFAVFIGIALFWWTFCTGFVSSNDGSHTALARALALRGETRIDPDVPLTLWVDRSFREGHSYSDRPPATAVAALPAVCMGDVIDSLVLERSIASGTAAFTPAAANFARAYEIRSKRMRFVSRPLVAYQGTAAALAAHTIAIGLLGALATWGLSAQLGLGYGARLVAVVWLCVATLWGPYSTALFSHATSGVCLALMIWAAGRATGDADRDRVALLAAGFAGATAVASDYSLALAVVPFFLLATRPRQWGFVAAGALLPVALTSAYHTAAFGAPWRLGYDFQSNFAFSRERTSTFSGSIVDGFWILWGLGRGAGMAALAPITLVGFAGLLLDRRARLWLLALAPWLLALMMHMTPYGGATEDHRYLVPALPVFAVGFALVWQWLTERSTIASRVLRVGLWALALYSANETWTHLLVWRGS